jgi:hypothetical protein
VRLGSDAPTRRRQVMKAIPGPAITGMPLADRPGRWPAGA